MFGAEQFPRVNTGTDLVVSSSNMLANTGTGGSATVQPMSPMDSIREMFVDMRDSLLAIAQNTAETNELIKVGVLGTPAEQRQEAIESGETDAPPKPEDDTGPSFLDRLKGLNPRYSKITVVERKVTDKGPSFGEQFHTDSIYTKKPPRFTMLLSKLVPRKGQANTEFSSQYLA